MNTPPSKQRTRLFTSNALNLLMDVCSICMLTDVGGQAAKPPRGFLCILIIIIQHLLLPWESMAAPRTAWSKVVKFGKLFGTSPLINFTKFHVSHSNPLAPPMGQSWRCVYTRYFWTICRIFLNEVSLDSLDQDKFNALYDIINSYIDSPLFWMLRKGVFLLLLQFFSNLLQNCHTCSSDQASQNVSYSFLIFATVC